MLALNLAISAADHDLAPAVAFRMATSRINGVVFVVEVSRGLLIATALHVSSVLAVGGQS
jgi:hypothetical protein